MNEIVNFSSKKTAVETFKKTVVEEPVTEELPAAKEPFDGRTCPRNRSC